MTKSIEIIRCSLNCYYNLGKSCNEIYELFGISANAFRTWRKEYEKQKANNGLLNPSQFSRPKTKRRPKKPKYDKKITDYVIRQTKQKAFRVGKVVNFLRKKYANHINRNAIYYILRKRKYTLKRCKKRVIKNKKEHRANIKQIKKDINQIGLDNVISIDEASFEINMSPIYGWSPKGKPVYSSSKKSDRKRVSLLSAISNKKTIYYELHEGTINSAIFLNFIKQLNKRCRNKVFLMDNCSIHRANIVKDHMKGLTNRIIYNAPYSPETNPIEQSYSQIKAYVRKENTETMASLKTNIILGINNITPTNYTNYFCHSFG